MIRILTDSATDFTQEELQKLNVRCVPMTIAFGGDTYTDGVDLPQEIFWQRMEAGQTPKTSQPSPDAFLREFEAAKAAGDSVLCVLISSALSGTLQSALIAVGMTEDLDVALVDSLSATVGERLLVQEACRMRDAGGKTAQEIAEALRLLVPRVCIFACLDTLEYLARGGRIPKAVADVGMLVKLKPLVTVSPDGLVAMAGKAHRPPSRRRRDHETDGTPPHRSALSADSALHGRTQKTVSRSFGRPEQAGYAAPLRKRFPSARPIGSHVGPGAFGVAYISA